MNHGTSRNIDEQALYANAAAARARKNSFPNANILNFRPTETTIAVPETIIDRTHKLARRFLKHDLPHEQDLHDSLIQVAAFSTRHNGRYTGASRLRQPARAAKHFDLSAKMAILEISLTV